MENNLEWIEIDRKKAGSYKIFDVHWSKRRTASGEEGDFVLVQAPDWVTIIPVTKNASGEECFIMVKQFRHGSGSLTIEFPAGAIDKDEDPMPAAIREMKEETGYSAQKISSLGAVNPNPAFMTNLNHFFVAEGLKKTQEQELDEHELIEIQFIPITQVKQEMGKGIFANGIMLIALKLYEQWKEDQQNMLDK